MLPADRHDPVFMRYRLIYPVVMASLLSAGCAEEVTEQDRMRAAVPELASLPAREDTAAGAYLNGRVAVLQSVDTTRSGWVPEGGYDLYLPLSQYDDRGADILATSLEEVGTVARLDCADTEATSYDEQGGTLAAVATREVCDMTLVDLSIPAVVNRHQFMGAQPAEVVTVDAASPLTVLSNPVSMTEVLAYLESLPRR